MTDTTQTAIDAGFERWLRKYTGRQDATTMRFSWRELKCAFEEGAALAQPSQGDAELLREAACIINSKPVSSVYASCEWDELSEDGKVWIMAIVAQAQKPNCEAMLKVRRWLVDNCGHNSAVSPINWIDKALARIDARISAPAPSDDPDAATGCADDFLPESAEQWRNALASKDQSKETWESINQWCDDTFGKASVPDIIKRAKEEFEELEEPDADHAIEAADVVICLCRVPGFAEALKRKMAINRRRKWRTDGNGTGYHIPEGPIE